MDTKFIDAADENLLECIEGYWYLPTDEIGKGEKIAGVLRFQTSGKGRLELLGALGGDPMGYEEFPVIYGDAVDDSKITIFNAITAGVHGNASMWRMALEVSAFWRSEARFFNSPSDIKFDKWSFGLNKLREWDGRNGFATGCAYNDDKEDGQSCSVRIQYSCLQDLPLYCDECVNINLSYFYSQSGWCVVQDRAVGSLLLVSGGQLI